MARTVIISAIAFGLASLAGRALVAAGNGSVNASRPKPAPSILFILSDQYRRDCVGISGNPKSHTPNLDRLAREGAWFDRTYTAQPVCSPNRAAIVTGLYPHSAGVQENCTETKTGAKELPGTSRTMSEMLAPAGYDCGYFGKWHLGRRDAFKTFPEYPKDGRGSDHYFGEGRERRYGVDVITEDAIAFLKRGRTQPFYVYVSFYPPHPPFSVPEKYLDRYKNIADRDQRTYYAMCEKIDEKVGELLEALEDLGVADSTLVVFTSDHGHSFIYRWNHHYKRLCYDTASRVPLIMRMPGVIPKGRRVDVLFSSVDLTPTILDLLGQPVPSGLQGLDLAALARGDTDKGRDHAFIENVPFTGNPDKGEERCVLDGRYKLILSSRRPPELYDLRDDPDEVANRWGELKSSPAVRRLISQLQAWAEKSHDTLAPELIAATIP
ncbi:MAG: sulfatase-like hydrolase/transferase [Planctomycetes bacterium]|nr:sulfatase-like hydrolase/transferase [Planctomycetota bacterium]